MTFSRLCTSDRLFCVSFFAFAITSWIFEPYVVFADLASSYPHGLSSVPWYDVSGWLWVWYAHAFDPVFLDLTHAPWLRVMCALDLFVFGACYLYLLYAFYHRLDSVRVPALLYGSAITYSTLVYFGYEFLYEAHRADLLAVLLVNIPYTIMPVLLVVRMWRHEKPFAYTRTKQQ